MSTNVLKRYILLNIYLNKWNPGDKIPSSQQLAIKFNLSLSTVKKELAKFKKNNVFTSDPRKGFFINQNLFKYVPLSIRQKYQLTMVDIKIEHQNNQSSLHKSYASKVTKAKIWVNSRVFTKVFKFSPYQKQKMFMYNLAWNGLVITKIKNKYRIKDIDGLKYLVENRQLYDAENQLLVDENIYIPWEIWFANDQFQF